MSAVSMAATCTLDSPFSVALDMAMNWLVVSATIWSVPRAAS